MLGQKSQESGIDLLLIVCSSVLASREEAIRLNVERIPEPSWYVERLA